MSRASSTSRWSCSIPVGTDRSDAPSDPRRHTVGDYVEDVLAVADELGFDRFAFWGHSDGGRVGYQLAAATAPGRVIALVAAGGVVPSPGEDPSEWFEPRARREHGIGGAILGEERMPAWAVRQVVEDGPRGCRAGIGVLASWQLWPQLAGIQAATLLVAGELESEHLADAAAGLQNGRAVVIPNVGHIGAFLRSDLVLPHVVPFLRSVTSA